MHPVPAFEGQASTPSRTAGADAAHDDGDGLTGAVVVVALVSAISGCSTAMTRPADFAEAGSRPGAQDGDGHQNGCMIAQPTPVRARAALVTGTATATYYATPDLIASRTARGWAKAGLTAVAVAASVPELRETWALARDRQELDGGTLPSAVFSSLPAGSKAVAVGFVAAVLTGSVASVVAAERWIFRRGQARAASGKRLPHTGPALLYGALAGGLWLLPEPPDPRRNATASLDGLRSRRRAG